MDSQPRRGDSMCVGLSPLVGLGLRAGVGPGPGRGLAGMRWNLRAEQLGGRRTWSAPWRREAAEGPV